MKTNKPLERLKHHVSGAIARGETVAITAVVNTATVAGLKIWENNGSIFLASEQEPQRARRHQSVESAELDIAHFQANGVLPRSAENLN